MISLQRLHLAFLTARRAGWRRSLARVRRILFLRWLNPAFATRLYPPRAVHPPRVDHLADLIPIAFRTTSPTWHAEITLLNSAPFPMRPPIDWNANPLGHTLWAFRLHEFDWAWQLIQLAVRGDAHAAQTLAAILRDYIERVPFGRGIAGEPYTLSRRLVVWSVAYHVIASRTAAKQSPNHNAEIALSQTPLLAMTHSIVQSARLLRHHIEHDLDNNHVIANAKALAFAGTLIGQTDLARFGFDLLWQQLRVQVRTDGMHFENSTSYHWHVLCDALDGVRLARQFDFRVPDDIPPRLEKMANVLRALCRPDGTLPLLNDSVTENLENVVRVLDQFDLPGKEKLTCFLQSGYAILASGNTWILFDAGALGPAFCPGHGHADALSFELWSRHRLLIADPGVYQYQAGTWRDYFRGTAAHSTIVVDGLDQSELADSFRVGTMADARFTRVDAEHLLIEGTHNGYQRLRPPVTHTRTLELVNENEVRIQDRLTGSGEHHFDLGFHLAPGARIEISSQSANVFFDDNVQLEFRFDGVSSFEIATSDGWYSPTWYTKLPAPMLHYRGRCAVPLTIETTIAIG